MLVTPKSFMCRTLKIHRRGEDIAGILAAAINAVNPEVVVSEHMRRNGTELTVENTSFDLRKVRRLYIISVGKAAFPMAQKAAAILGNDLDAGIIITKEGHAGENHHDQLRVFEAAHPITNQRGIKATETALELVRDLSSEDLVLCLISGGGSALLEALPPGVQLQEYQALIQLLLESGANIHEINTIRKHLSKVKGGHLARIVHPAKLVTMILSDVVGDNLDIIASGPTVPDPSSFTDAVKILDRYGLPIHPYLLAGKSGDYPETPKPGQIFFSTVNNTLVGNNHTAAVAGLAAAAKAGLQTKLLTTELVGKAGEAGKELASVLRNMPEASCWVAGGETTVLLEGQYGLGGRNLELALAAVQPLAGQKNTLLISLATDGGDGPTDAAGAVVSGDTYFNASKLGLYPGEYLSSHDSYHFFDPLGDLLKPGPTQTNVNDLVFMVRI